ncbi:hypothetical protein PoB_005150200 [Plakobranchus ocellatus]|uniref:Uncharacterized protein n=1 Tax=Plakobranchus ocellatus TaxID=259542 RepID=A0AAV4C0W5_9GAST|nr:hypothetical protein PoB_005150200 [Plakobranchus ocellatus]
MTFQLSRKDRNGCGISVTFHSLAVPSRNEQQAKRKGSRRNDYSNDDNRLKAELFASLMIGIAARPVKTLQRQKAGRGRKTLTPCIRPNIKNSWTADRIRGRTGSRARVSHVGSHRQLVVAPQKHPAYSGLLSFRVLVRLILEIIQSVGSTGFSAPM